MSTESQSRLVIHGVPLFLTAFDPSDLPGTSIDPLGFERGYLFLADKILPGLTNVASKPRYFSALCAGASLADFDTSAPLQLQYRKRIESVLRFERFWALSNVLAIEQHNAEYWIAVLRGAVPLMTMATLAAYFLGGHPRIRLHQRSSDHRPRIVALAKELAVEMSRRCSAAKNPPLAMSTNGGSC